MDEPDHLEFRADSETYRYVRRVPREVAHLDRRGVVRKGLRTGDYREAAAKAIVLDQSLDEYWAALARGADSDDAWERHKKALALAKSLGFTYQPAAQLLAGPAEEVVRRLVAIGEHDDAPVVATALLGTGDEPDLKVSELFSTYLKYKATDLIGYSPSQRKKHENPKRRAAFYLGDVLGKDRMLGTITRDDALRYREWWDHKIAAEGLTVDAANRSFSDIQGMLNVVDRALKTNYRAVWGGLNFKGTAQTRSKKRAVYDVTFIQSQILQPSRLDSVNLEARLIFYALIETGARPSEICNLKPDAIHLDAEIPHIEIEEVDRILKSRNATRRVPLVGVSLWAMKQAPQGFPSYRDNEDSYSATMNKALGAHGLRPSKRHSVYSVRHTFSDRILAAGATDRMQTDLMGHEFGRPKYGDGAALQQKLELLTRIKFDWDMDQRPAP